MKHFRLGLRDGFLAVFAAQRDLMRELPGALGSILRELKRPTVWLDAMPTMVWCASWFLILASCS